MKERKIWVDWMKVIGMLFIIWGHFTPNFLTNYIYTFNVPLFFFISGGLTNDKTGGKKIFHNLLIPYAIIAITLILYSYIKPIVTMNVNLSDIGRTTLAFVTGEQRVIVSTCPQVKYLPGCGTLWFVYALAIIKLLFRTTNMAFLFISLPVSLFLAYLIPSIKPIGNYAIFTVPLAWFFFVLGYIIMHSVKFKCFHDKIKIRLKENISTICVFVVLVILLSVLLYFIGEYNGQVKFFKAEWGNSMMLMLFGSFIGIVCMYLISVMLELFFAKTKHLIMISNGTIIILAYHIQIIYLMYRTFLNGRNDILTFILSVIIMFLFIPIIGFVMKYIPVMIGKRKLN